MTKRIVITSGLALFAMFFGAGNIIYPLELGAQAGSHISYVIAAFLITGIGLPFLGLFATGLYQGDYWAFFQRLGRTPAFLLITFLILIIGPLFAAPRTAVVTFHTVQSFLPPGLNNLSLFSAFYCIILFLLTFQHSKVIDIIGRFLSPIKLTLFFVLIFAGFLGSHEILENKNTIASSVKLGLLDGYSTMDLLATFFFCSAVCQNIVYKTKACGITDPKAIVKIFLLSCILGGILLSLVYVGFMFLALYHAPELQGVDTAQMIVTISNSVLGKFGSFFVGICVSVACIVTATALTDITTSFIYNEIARKKVPRIVCLLGVLVTIFAMSILGFSVIMKIALPILEVLYPALIIYCVINIVIKMIRLRKDDALQPVEQVS